MSGKNAASTAVDIEEQIPLRTNGDALEVKFAECEKDSIMSSSRSISEANEDAEPKIPDGGWGWVVVFSSLLISMFADGVSFSFGLMFSAFLKEFGASKTATSWIGSLFISVPLLTGPIMSALVDRYGCRNMTILGGIVSTIGLVLSAFAGSLEMMYLTFGIVAGLGLGLVYVTAVVSIAYWFDKKRTLAIGLGACGSGLGTFIYAPMTNYFIQEYRWRGAMILLAGTFANFCVCGCLMKDPEWWIEEQKRQYMSKSSKKSSSMGSVSARSAPEDFPDVEEIRKLLKGGGNHEYLLQSLVTSMETPEGAIKAKEIHRSDFSLPTFIKQNETVPIEVLEKLKANDKVYKVILENYPSLLVSRSTSDRNLNKIAEKSTSRVPVTFSMKLKKTAPPNNAVSSKNKELVHQQSLPAETCQPLIAKKAPADEKLQRSDSIPWLKRQFSTTNYYKNIRLHRNSIMYRGAMLNIKKYRLRASSCPNIYRNSMITLAQETEDKWYTELLSMFSGMADFSMFSEFHFLLTSLATILIFTFFIIPYFYLAEHMTNFLGYSESEASFVISVIGILHTVSMVILGWAGDQPWINVTKTYAVCLIACGTVTICMILTTNYYWLLVWATLFGLFFASCFSFTPVILVELLPLERFTTAYGLILLCQGIGHLVGPPIGGFLFDVTGRWDQSFYQAGIWIIISGILVGIIPFTKNRKLWGTGPVEKELAASERGSCA